jgi:hypothetical protein
MHSKQCLKSAFITVSEDLLEVPVNLFRIKNFTSYGNDFYFVFMTKQIEYFTPRGKNQVLPARDRVSSSRRNREL